MMPTTVRLSAAETSGSEPEVYEQVTVAEPLVIVPTAHEFANVPLTSPAFTVVLAVSGDIVGMGVFAATVSGLMRHGTRRAAQQRPDPAAVLEQLDTALKSHPSDVTSTMLCARLGEREVTVASAGHPPPLVANMEGETRELRAHGPMLGAFDDAEWRARTFELARGDLVLFYTEGITEALGGRKGLGRDRLRMLLAAQAGRRPAEVVEALGQALDGVVVRDDLAALVLRRR